MRDHPSAGFTLEDRVEERFSALSCCSTWPRSRVGSKCPILADARPFQSPILTLPILVLVRAGNGGVGNVLQVGSCAAQKRSGTSFARAYRRWPPAVRLGSKGPSASPSRSVLIDAPRRYAASPIPTKLVILGEDKAALLAFLSNCSSPLCTSLNQTGS